MIPDYLIHTFALLGALNFAGILLGVAWCAARVVADYLRARRGHRALVQLVREQEADEARNTARMADEWELRQAAERLEVVP